MTTRRWVNALLAGASAAIAGLLLAGCADDNSSDVQPLPEAKPAETAASPGPDVEYAEALAAYRAMWDDLAVAAVTSNARHPRLQTHASGGALELMRHMMTEDRKEKVVTKGRLHLSPTVENGDATRVVIRDCADASEWLHYTRDGKLENDVPGGHHRVDATVRPHGGDWRVERLYIDQVGSC